MRSIVLLIFPSQSKNILTLHCLSTYKRHLTSSSPTNVDLTPSPDPFTLHAGLRWHLKIRKAAIVKKENAKDVRIISFDPSKHTVEDVANTVADAFDHGHAGGHHEHTATLIYLNYSPSKKH